MKTAPKQKQKQRTAMKTFYFAEEEDGRDFMELCRMGGAMPKNFKEAGKKGYKCVIQYVQGHHPIDQWAREIQENLP